MEAELRTAHDMQVGLMPASAPRVEGLDIAGRCQTANHVGGDFFQYYTLQGGRLAVCTADVTGHAMEAAIPVVLFSGILESQMEREPGLEALFAGLNHSMCRVLQRRTFVCFAMVEVEPGRLRVANAACPPAYLFRAASGTVEEMLSETYPLGVSARSSYPIAEVPLGPGDRLVLCSDGIVEAQSEAGELFGYERTMEAVRAGCERGLGASALLDELFATVEAFCGSAPVTDDRTCVVVGVGEQTS
ncbi:MAG: PP2C family protein-serine/threonine phosphatase [Candidatus Latescibacterota bacterium]